MRRLALAAAFAGIGSAVFAHDTWFEPLAAARPGEQRLALGTGNQFPVHDSAIDPIYLRQQGCRSADAALPLTALNLTDTALLMSAPSSARSCWAQLAPFEITLPADKIAVYLNEVRPAQPVLDAWAAISARGLPWKERYTKHARIVLAGAGEAARQPSGMAMDVLLETAAAPLRTGSPLAVQVLREGQPLAGLAVEFRNDRARISLWRRSDADGRVGFQPPLPGQWVLRGVDLRLSARVPDSWDSDFITLAFEVQPQNGSTLKLNTRSASQTPEITAISSEPPTNTARW